MAIRRSSIPIAAPRIARSRTTAGTSTRSHSQAEAIPFLQNGMALDSLVRSHFLRRTAAHFAGKCSGNPQARHIPTRGDGPWQQMPLRFGRGLVRPSQFKKEDGGPTGSVNAVRWSPARVLRAAASVMAAFVAL